MKITGITIKQTKKGDDYKLLTLDNGKKLSVFQFDSRYGEMNVGTDVPDSVLVYDNAYDNYKLKPLERPTTFIKGPNGRVPIREAMETKNENIKEAQERKNSSIQMAAAQRDAVLMVTTFEAQTPFPTDAELKQKIEQWMKYFLNLHEQPFI